jgi:hypothetical protein
MSQPDTIGGFGSPPVLPPRVPWTVEFPSVIVHTDVVLRDNHPFYLAAKAGDEQAALALVEDLLAASATEDLRELLAGRQPILLPITA